jgi:hypothetical protein
MALLEPKPEDVRKIHAEINQLVNQRFLLTTVAITAFGVVMGTLVPRNPPPASGLGGFVFLMAMVLSVLLFALFLLSHLYKGMTRVYSGYLIETKASNWEVDWKEFRKDKYVGYTKPQTLIFLTLNAITVAFPFLMSKVYGVPYEHTWGAIILLVMGGTFELLMIAMGLGNWLDRERKAEQQWRAQNAS